MASIHVITGIGLEALLHAGYRAAFLARRYFEVFIDFFAMFGQGTVCTSLISQLMDLNIVSRTCHPLLDLVKSGCKSIQKLQRPNTKAPPLVIPSPYKIER